MGNQELGTDLRSILSILQRQSRLILTTVALITAIALVYVLTAIPIYRAEALLLVDPSEQNLLDPRQATSTAGASLNARVESEVEILRSPATALALVQAANLMTDPEFGPRLSTSQKLMQAIGIQNEASVDGDDLLKGIVTSFMNARDVRRKGLTFVISVGVSSEDPKRAAYLANTLAQTYISEQVTAKIESRLADRDVLRGQIVTARQRLALSEEKVDHFIFDNLSRLETESGEDAITQLRIELESTQKLQQARIAMRKEAQSALEARDWVTLTSTLEDEALAELDRQRQSLAQALGNVTSGPSTAIDLQNALEAVEADLASQTNLHVQALQREVRRLDDKIDGVRDGIRLALQQSNLPSSTLAEVFTIQQEAELARENYQILLSRLSELETQAAVQIADSRVVSEALPPTKPSSPKQKMILAVAVVVGLGLGVGLAFANEFYVGGVTSQSQLANVMQTPVVGSVPEHDHERGSPSVADVVVDQPLSAYAESLRQIRATIDQSLRRNGKSIEDGAVILVSSAVPAEGKSTTALALARTYSLSGVSTVLIDADLRKPALARQMNLNPESSLLQYLSVQNVEGTGMSFLSSDPRSSLQVLVGEGRSSIPTDQLIVSKRFRSMLADARGAGYVVIIDSPPIVPVVDARYIADQADLVLLVARFGLTTQADIRYAYEQIQSASDGSVPILGLLSHEERHDKLYRYSGYYTE